MEDLTVAFTDPLRIDLDVFNLWLEGCSEAEATRRRLKQLSPQNISYNIVFCDTMEQYQVFKMLEKYLQNPQLFSMQMLCTISPSVQQKLIERYYGFDKEVIREFLGKKMSAKLRKDLDDVSEKTGIPLNRCKRQFDNIKNVLKAYEDSEATIHDTVTKQFLIPDSLARYAHKILLAVQMVWAIVYDKQLHNDEMAQRLLSRLTTIRPIRAMTLFSFEENVFLLSRTYSSMLFIFVHRFETGKKRLNHLTFDNFVFCADLMLQHWIDADQDDLDREFFQEIREIRNFTNEKEVVDHHKSLVFSDLEKQNYGHLVKVIEPVFKELAYRLIIAVAFYGNASVSRNVFSIGYNLTNNRDVRDFFIDLTEKIIDPLRQCELSISELQKFLHSFVTTWDEFPSQYSRSGSDQDMFTPSIFYCGETQRLGGVFKRYTETIFKCLMELYHI